MGAIVFVSGLIAMKYDGVIHEFFVFVDEFAGEEAIFFEPFEEDAVAGPEVEVEDFVIVDPF